MFVERNLNPPEIEMLLWINFQIIRDLKEEETLHAARARSKGGFRPGPIWWISATRLGPRCPLLESILRFSLVQLRRWRCEYVLSREGNSRCWLVVEGSRQRGRTNLILHRRHQWEGRSDGFIGWGRWRWAVAGRPITLNRNFSLSTPSFPSLELLLVLNMKLFLES